MLEIRRGLAVRHYENSFFREFSKNLKSMFDKYNLNGLMIANSECIADERLQIDTLLITQHTVCIIDFKNFSGDIILPTSDDFFNGSWVNSEGHRIKGGSSINPYKQLTFQKKKFLSNSKKEIVGIYDEYIKKNLTNGDVFNPRHILKIVCFQNKITLQGSIPPKNEIDFLIMDSTNYLERIKDIIDISSQDVDLSPNSYTIFKEIFKADKFDLDEEYNQTNKLNIEIENLNYDKLYNDQKDILKQIEKFLQTKDGKIFILNGSANSGKSYLIPYIEQIAYKHKIQEINKIVQSGRIANNLSTEDLKFQSMYSYIYGGGDNSENSEIKVIPIKSNSDEEDALYIIDQAQLITNSFYKSIDLQFGSGHLLEDLLDYIQLGKSNRKVIFIGDPYQATIGSKEETSLGFDYLGAKYKIEAQSFNLTDKPNFSYNTKQALKCVESIKKDKYNLLSFDFSDSFQKIKKNILKDYVESRVHSNFKILVYSNKNAQEINLWIKKSIIKTGEHIAKNDLILFNNNIEVGNKTDPFSYPKQVFNGEFAVVESVSNLIEEKIDLKGDLITLVFKELTVKLEKSNEVINILSFENFRLNDKNELSDNEIIAFKILLSKIEKETLLKSVDMNNLENYCSQINELKYFNKLKEDGRTKADNTEQQDIKKQLAEIRKSIKKELLTHTSKYYRYKNAAYLKFGWAMTTHKAISYKFNEVLINADTGDYIGKKEEYFRWLYSGVTRAIKSIKLINYKEISPLSKININISNRAHSEFFFLGNKDGIQTNISSKENFIFPEDKPFLYEFYNFILSKIASKGIKISSINHPRYQEQYEFFDSNNTAMVSMYYNDKAQFREPSLIVSSDENFGNKIISILLNDNILNNFEFVGEDFRQEIYTKLNQNLNNENIYISYIIQKSYKDEIKFICGDRSLIIELNYNGDGFFTQVNIFDNQNPSLAQKIKNILESCCD